MSASMQDPVPAVSPTVGVVDPAPRPVRRAFSAEFRARVVAEYQAAPHGQKAAVLRREGLYQSQIREWTAAADAVAAGAAAPRKSHHRGLSETETLRRENQRLTRELAKSRAVVDVLGKLHGLLDAICESPDTTPTSTTH
jgi:transposase